MKFKSDSADYQTERISYPSSLDKQCVLCNSKVKFAYPDGGKMVRTLEGKVYQIVNYYKCSNPECKFHLNAFNPSPRFDYSNRHFGADVFRLISDEFLLYELNPEQITKRLNKKYAVDISDDTVLRMCDDILKLKSLKIDERTLEIIADQKFMLLGFDGQDPGSGLSAIWSFKDIISNRILATYKFESLDYQVLHETIEKIREMYGVKIIGWISDKQNVITACHDLFYHDVPHQYCQYHFLNNIWSHLTSFDSKVYSYLKKTVRGLYIHTASKSSKVMFERVGKVSVREVFKNTDKDLQSMIRVRNKRFKELRGTWFYEELEKYVEELENVNVKVDPSYRFAKILTKTINVLRIALEYIKPTYLNAKDLSVIFQSIRNGLFKEKFSTIEDREKHLSGVFENISSKIKKEYPEIVLEDCKSFIANKKSEKPEILGEWYRLWNSYRPGLFIYAKFPIKEKTNNPSENGFSRQKQAIFNRVAKSMVGHMVATRGEDYLRIKHCTPEELEEDIVEQYCEEVVRELREKLQEDIKNSTSLWKIRERLRRGITIDYKKYIFTEEELGCEN